MSSFFWSWGAGKGESARKEARDNGGERDESPCFAGKMSAPTANPQGILPWALLLALSMLVNCRISQIPLHPLPSRIERMEGYASITQRGEQGSGRARFFFLFQLPRQGRIEISDTLGRTLYQVIVSEERAFFLLPSKKVYWEGGEEEVIDYFLGFRLNLDEMASLVMGEWKWAEDEGRPGCGRDGWTFRKDESNRVVVGQRGTLRFEVKEFFAGTSFPRLLFFEHPLNQGRLKILSLRLNEPLRESDVFSLSLLRGYRRVSWEEIERLLSDENEILRQD